MEYWQSIGIILFCLTVEGFFSGAEIALVAVDRIRVQHLAQSGSWAAQRILRFLENPEWAFCTLIFCHNLAFVTAVTVATSILIKLFGIELADLLTLIFISPLLLILGEIVPKSLFQERADQITFKAVYPIWLASVLLFPILYPLGKLISLIQWLIGQYDQKPPSFFSREELKMIVQMTDQDTDVKPEEQTMIRRIFSFSDTAVKEAMVPLVEIVAEEDTATVDDVIRKVVEKGFSRIPIYHQEIHNIIGIVKAHDLLKAQDRSTSIKDFIRPTFYVPEQKRIDDLLREMQQKRIHMAIVVDEYGGSVGLVTLEDLLEEIVGEIEDEYDPSRQLFTRLADGSYIVNGRMEIDRMNEELGLNIPKGDYETLGGFIINHLQAIPEPGDSFAYENLNFIIRTANKKRVEEVKITRRPTPSI
jgi:CBS domain containing-hemolysin-like protein